MRGIRRLSPIVRAVGVIGVVAGLVTSVTFAALSSSATLSQNTIGSATAGLLISNGGGYSSSEPGFAFSDITPGVPVVKNFYLWNNGTSNLLVNAKVPVAPALTGIANPSAVKVVFKDDQGTISNAGTLADLESVTGLNVPGTLAAGAQGVAAAPGTPGNYTISVDLDGSQISGSSASVAPFDIVFTGTAQ